MSAIRFKTIVFLLLFMTACTKDNTFQSENCSDGITSDLDIKVIPIDSALNNLNSFFERNNLNTTKSGEERIISSIETYYSKTIVTKAGDFIPDAYLINFKNQNGFAVLGANTNRAPIIAAVETGNASWDKLLNPIPQIDNTLISDDYYDDKNSDESKGEDDEDCDEDEQNEWGDIYLSKGLSPNQIISLCISAALKDKGRIDMEDDTDSEPEDEEDHEKKKKTVGPLLPRGLYFNQNVTYCHKAYNRFVTNGCASTALSMLIAYLNYPAMTVDHEVLNFSLCGVKDADGVFYEFPDDEIFVRVTDYFKNCDIFPPLSLLSSSDFLKFITAIDKKVIKKHGYPSISREANIPFYRTRFKLTSAVYYSLYNIVKSWDGTGATPDAVSRGLKELGFINVSKESKKSISKNQISTIYDMIKAGKPVLVCGWSLFELSNSHYWIIDGIEITPSDTLIHCIWGHSEKYIGWFSTDCIKEENSAIVKSKNTDNEWNNLVIYKYDLKSITPEKEINVFYDKHRVQY